VTTYLGMPIRTAVAVAVFAAAIGAGISAAIPTPDVYGDDGYPVLTAVEYADVLNRMDAIRDARTGGRFNEGSR
jgi:hypothetical protein